MEDVSQDPFHERGERSLVVAQVVHSKDLSAKYGKVTGRLLLSHSICWLLENFCRQTFIALFKTDIF